MHRKFKKPGKGFWERSYALLRSALLMLFFTALVIMALHLRLFTRFFVLHIFGAYFLLEIILAGFAFPKGRGKEGKPRRVIDKNLSLDKTRLFIADFVLLIFSIWAVQHVKYGRCFANEQAVYYMVILVGLWFFFSLWTGKFESGRTGNIYHYASPFFRTALLMALASAFIMFVINFREHSRVMLFGPVILLAVLESVIILPHRMRKKIKTESQDIETYVEALARFRQEELADSAHKKIKFKRPVDTDLKEQYLKDTPVLYAWLSGKINLSKIEASAVDVVNTRTLFNVQVLEDSSKQLFINLRRVNDYRQINRFFLEIHQKLAPGGYFVGCKSTMRYNMCRIYRKYPRVMAHIVYFFDFLLHRVWPKMPWLNTFYYILFKNRSRILSKAELYGRLSFCGFEVIASRHIRGSRYFIASKIKNPSLESNPSYGPVISLKRVGYNGQFIEIYKFRTMHPYSEFIQDLVYSENNLDSNGKIKNDYRLTQWGKVMRRLWIDELPQLVNFFKGDLNLVGVRALSLHYYSLYPKDVRAMRIQVKLGILPPYYADMPKDFDAIVESERRYIERKQEKPLITDVVYFWKIFYNITFKKARSL